MPTCVVISTMTCRLLPSKKPAFRPREGAADPEYLMVILAAEYENGMDPVRRAAMQLFF